MLKTCLKNVLIECVNITAHAEGIVNTYVKNAFASIFSINHYPADHNYCRFKPVLFVDQITVNWGRNKCLNIKNCK